ncbi:MAG: ATP-binding protein [Chitinophagales bacterium]
MEQQKKIEEPLYFMDLVVENVRCFKEKQTVDLSNEEKRPAQWTIILGDNGTGKTTLLKCLAFLQPQKKEFALDESGILYGIGLLGASFLDITIKFFSEGNRRAFIRCNFFSEGKISSNTSKLKYFTRYEISHLDSSYSGLIIEDFHEENIFIIAYGASRKMGTGSLTESRNPFPMATLFDENASLINAEAWLLETDYAIKSAKGETKKYLQKHYKKVKETLQNLLPDVEDFRIREITKTQTQAAIEVKTPYGWVAMKNLSLGYQSFIAWVVDLAARLFERYPDSENPLEEPCIVLVDEIDLHLHPKWQRKVIDFLTQIFKNAQFIVTAHSPLIVQSAENANIVLLKREGDSVKIYNNKDEDVIKGWRVDQILTSDLFGLESARPPKYDSYLKRKKEILEKDELSEKDKEELEEIAKHLEEMPLGNELSNDALEALKKAAEILKAQ